ncbi:hypothetical protein [Sedimentibacter saalensis]|uniref:hypothetical protein n=1 Tax=Sedimentibacter saalensis TaxID=130788 RepID=UPI0028988C8A|nr:hypothetical protein [Sedimentibacter saalensis]
MDKLPSNIDDIEKFLIQVRDAIKINNCDFANRRKCMLFLAQIGYTIQDAYDEINDLKYTDYFSGPEADYDPKFSNDDIWVFKKPICGHITYIKIKIRKFRNNQMFCMSFHEDEL